MRVSEKGQVTIPIEIRRRLQILPDTEVAFRVVGNEVRMRKVGGSTNRGRSLVSQLRGKATTTLSTDEIMALTRAEK